jgi:uncharacterized membrane protein
LNPYKWFGAVVLYTVLTLVCVFFISSDSTLSFLTYFFGFTFVAVVPGYCLVNLLFQEGKLELVETVVLSVALSFSIAGISGLFLGLSPIGITFSSVTQSLTIIVLVLAFLAFLRKIGFFGKLRAKKP